MNNKKYFIGISFVAILFIGLICHFKSTYVSRAISDHDIKMEGAIKKIVAENFKHDFPTLSLPHIFIDSSLIKTIRNDSLITVSKLYGDTLTKIESNIAEYFTNYYKTKDSLCSSKSILPFVIYPKKMDSNGNIIMQPNDMENIKQHIQFLTNQVDKAITDVKNELSRDIERLNMWTSIWIGIFGVFGALLPLFIAFSSQKETKDQFIEIKKDILKLEDNVKTEIQTDRDKINEDVKKAHEQIDKVSTETKGVAVETISIKDRVAEINDKLEKQDNTLEEKSEALDKLMNDIELKEKDIAKVKLETDALSTKVDLSVAKSENALKKSEKSLSESKEVKAIVYLSHSLSNIKRMDLSKISLFKVKLEQYLADNFGRIKKDLLQYKSAINNSQQELFNELIKELILSLRQLKPLLNKRAQLSNIGILEKSFENLLVSSDENLEESFNDVISKLEELIKTLLE